ncbi:MAG: ABC transporter ATP-binding protein [Planctomycetota bacterium]|nr:ABC transporter ATP-binding protein [Planctomycetota bacterium]
MNELRRICTDYLKPHWLRMVVIAVLSLLVALSPFLFGYLSRVMVDDVLRINATIDLDLSLEGHDDRLHLFTLIIGALLGSHLLLIGANALHTYLLRTLAFDVIYRIRHELHDKFQALQVGFFDRNLTGKLMARLLDDVGAMNNSISTVFMPGLTATASLAIGIYILFWIEPTLAVLALLALPVSVLAHNSLIGRVRTVHEGIRALNAEMYGAVGDALNGIKVVKTFVRERGEEHRFKKINLNRFRLLHQHATLSSILSGISSLAGALGLAVVLYVGTRMTLAGEMTTGSFLFFYTSAALLFGPLNVLLSLHVQVQAVIVSARKVFEILDHKVTIKDRADARDLETATGWVIFAGVWFRYPGYGLDVLRNLTFEVPPATRIALVGASGAGKTTISNLLTRFYDVTAGEILLDMVDIRSLKLESLRKHIRIVPQEPILFSNTIREIIRYGHPDATDKDVIRAAITAQIHDFIEELPDGYDTIVGEEGVALSGGQRQRLAFAMALVTNPTVLILDDSTSALDVETASQLEEAMDTIMAGRTVFIITHRLATAMRSDRILVLDQGRLVEEGTHDYLMSTGGRYSHLFATQVQMQFGAKVEAI